MEFVSDRDPEILDLHHAVKRVEDRDSNDFQVVKSGHEYLAKVISEIEDQPFGPEFSLEGEAIEHEFSGEGISGILNSDRVNVGKMKNPEDQNEESLL